MKTKNSIKNSISSIITNVITILMGFIAQKIFINIFRPICVIRDKQYKKSFMCVPQTNSIIL